MTGSHAARSPDSEGKEDDAAVGPGGPGNKTRSAPRRGMVLVAAALGFGAIQLDVSVVNVAEKPIGAALSGGVSGVQWVAALGHTAR